MAPLCHFPQPPIAEVDRDLLRMHSRVSALLGPAEKAADFCGEENDQVSATREKAQCRRWQMCILRGSHKAGVPSAGLASTGVINVRRRWHTASANVPAQS